MQFLRSTVAFLSVAASFSVAACGTQAKKESVRSNGAIQQGGGNSIAADGRKGQFAFRIPEPPKDKEGKDEQIALVGIYLVGSSQDCEFTESDGGIIGAIGDVVRKGALRAHGKKAKSEKKEHQKHHGEGKTDKPDWDDVPSDDPIWADPEPNQPPMPCDAGYSRYEEAKFVPGQEIVLNDIPAGDYSMVVTLLEDYYEPTRQGLTFVSVGEGEKSYAQVVLEKIFAGEGGSIILDVIYAEDLETCDDCNYGTDAGGADFSDGDAE